MEESKIKKGRLYFTEEGFMGKMIEGNTLLYSNTKSIQLNEEDQKQILSYLREDYNISHLCISFYRDAIIIGEDTYNICLSCGDFWKNDKKFYLDNNSLENLKTYLNNLKSKK